MRLSLKVTARASKNEIAGWADDKLRVRIAAVPEKGRANAALVDYLADLLGIARRQVRVVSGKTSAHKVIEIMGMDEHEVRLRLLKALDSR